LALGAIVTLINTTGLHISMLIPQVFAQPSQQVPLIAIPWDNAGYGGTRRAIVTDTPNLALENFDKKASAIGVYRGPDYDSWKAANGGKEPTVSLFVAPNYGEAEPILVLTAGACANLGIPYNFNDITSSVKFNARVLAPTNPPCPIDTPRINSLPLIVVLYVNAFFSGIRATMIGDSAYFPNVLGKEFHDSVTNVKVIPGPSYTPGDRVDLCQNVNFGGDCYSLRPGSFDIGSRPYNFNDQADSIRFVSHNSSVTYPTPWECTGTGSNARCCMYTSPDQRQCRVD
jgi:hypothetical protein